MADTSNVRVLYGHQGAADPLNLCHFGILTGTVLAPGDLTCYTNAGGGAVAMTASSDNTIFRGICLDYSASGKTDPVQVLLRGRCTITTSSATYELGDALKYSAGANGTDWVLEAATSGAGGVFWSMEYKASATSLTVQWDSFLVSAGIGSGSSPWEAFAS